MSEDEDLVITHAPLDGLPGYTAWRIVAPSADVVEKYIEILRAAAGAQSSSFTTPRQITIADGKHHLWWWAEGYIVDNTSRGQHGN